MTGTMYATNIRSLLVKPVGPGRGCMSDGLAPAVCGGTMPTSHGSRGGACSHGSQGEGEGEGEPQEG